MSKPVRVVFDSGGVEVYDPEGRFLGGVTDRRLQDTALVADAFASILRVAGVRAIAIEAKVEAT